MSSWARVLGLLDSYGVEPYERERERVQVAILKLSAGSEEKVCEYVAEKRERVRKMFEKFGIEPPSDL